MGLLHPPGNKGRARSTQLRALNSQEGTRRWIICNQRFICGVSSGTDDQNAVLSARRFPSRLSSKALPDGSRQPRIMALNDTAIVLATTGPKSSWIKHP